MTVRILLIAVFLACGALVANAQQVCISQEAANKCAENVTVVESQAKEIEAMRIAIDNRDKIIEELKIKVATESQKAVEREAAVLRMTAILEAMLKSCTKPKKWGIIVF